MDDHHATTTHPTAGGSDDPCDDQPCHEPLTHTVRATPHDTGRIGERLAARHLAGHGMQVLATRWRIAAGPLRGELDVVAVDVDGSALVVCEVKTRRDADRFGGAVAALGVDQRRRISRLTTAFLSESRLRLRTVRFDLVAVDLGRHGSLTHVPHAW
ncbi:MAG: YraN family protein [Nitriliruptoraceae bacterium]